MSREIELAEMVFDHVCENHPEAVADFSDEDIERYSLIAVRRALELGLSQQAAIVAYATLLFVAGPQFDQQPNIKKALTDPALSPEVRVQKLFENTVEADWDEAADLPDEWPDA